MAGQGRYPFQSAWPLQRRRRRRLALSEPATLPFTDQAQADVFSDWFFGAGIVTHDLVAVDIAAGTPTTGTPAAGVVHVLTAVDLSSGVPTVGQPVAALVHALVATDLTAGVPQTGMPALDVDEAPVRGSGGGGMSRGIGRYFVPVRQPPVVVAMTATGASAGVPTVGRPAATQEFNPVLMDNDLLLLAA